MNHGSAESIALLLEYASHTLDTAGTGVEPKEPPIFALPQEKADWLALVTEIRKLKAEVHSHHQALPSASLNTN